MDAKASVNWCLQLVEKAIEELRKGQSDMQQSIVDLTNLIARIHVQPIEENQEQLNDQEVRQKNQAIHAHNNQLYGNNLPGYTMDDSDSFEHGNMLNAHQDS